jgi:translation initiation factor IF-3
VGAAVTVSEGALIVQSKRVRRNDDIIAPSVRVIGAEGEQVGIMPTAEALAMAREASMDLVEVAPQAEPPVCRVMDYGKYAFELNKKAQTARKKQKQIQLKEVKFRPGTDEGDYQVKLRNLIKFLSNGDKAKVTLRFRGREMAHQELGLQAPAARGERPRGIRAMEQRPQMEGRQMVMVLAPKKR